MMSTDARGAAFAARADRADGSIRLMTRSREAAMMVIRAILVNMSMENITLAGPKDRTAQRYNCIS